MDVMLDVSVIEDILAYLRVEQTMNEEVHCRKDEELDELIEYLEQEIKDE
jgi:hypothetical protein